MVLPRAPGQPGVVLELNVRNRRKRESAKAAMAAAPRQIRDRDDAAEWVGPPPGREGAAAGCRRA